ncbi:hydrolase [Clostridia bacterium]|nr:hydrolase [Clostridia bacterium]
MRISDNVTMLDIDLRGFIMHPVIIRDGEQFALVDTGVPEGFDELEQAAEREGFSLSQLTHIILTHQDWDHVGNVRALRARVPGIVVVAHEAEIPYITGERIARLPAEHSCPVDKSAADGDALLGARVIHAPGHTPGHMVLLKDGVLIAGDALGARDGKLTVPDPKYTENMRQARQSMSNVVNYGAISAVLTYHGGHVSDNVMSALAEIANV